MTAPDTLGPVGGEGMGASRLLHALAEALEKVVASESAEAIEQAREQARKLLAEVRPLVDRAEESSTRLRDVIRQHPFLAIGAAAATGFILASLRRK